VRCWRRQGSQGGESRLEGQGRQATHRSGQPLGQGFGLTQFPEPQRLNQRLGQGWLQMQTWIEAQAVEDPDKVSQFGVVEVHLQGANPGLTAAQH
jgi:hypothetical protein